MSQVCSGGFADKALRRSAVARRVANALYLAAAPTFAIMALITGVVGGPTDALCSAAGASPLGGMVPMYVLMSAFHLAPWLKLISGRRNRKRPDEGTRAMSATAA